MIISDIEPDDDYNGVGDISQQNETPNVVMTDNSTMGAKHIYITNKTSGNIFISVKIMNSWTANEEWIVTDWIKILPDERKYVGENVQEFLYYYAYSKKSDGSFIEWKGDVSYNKVGVDGTYGFRIINIDPKYVSSEDEWTFEIIN